MLTQPTQSTTDTKDLKRGVDYYLTFDFWPHGGTKVRLVSTFPAKDVFPGKRGVAAKVVDDEGVEFLIGPNAYLFNTPPRTAKSPSH